MGLDVVPKRRHKGPPRKPAKRVTTGRGKGHEYTPTEAHRRKVENLAFCNLSEKQIALSVGIPETTLRRHFRTEINNGRMNVESELSHEMVDAARKGDRTLRIYISKAVMGWKEGTRLAVGFEDEKGKAIPPSGLFTINIPGVTDAHGS